MAAYRHLLDASRIRVDDAGRTITETVIIGPADRSGASDAVLINALSLLPARGAAHPVDSTLQLLTIEGTAQQEGALRFTLEWGLPRSESDNPLLDTTGIVEFFGAVQAEVTTRDKDGTHIQISWSGVLSDIFPDSSAVGSLSWADSPQVEVLRPTYGVQLTRRVANIGLVETYAETYVGKVNSATYSGKGVRTLLMLDVQGSNANPEDIRAVFRMAYRPTTWDFEGIAKPYGRVPANITNSPPNGIATHQMYELADFTALPVSF